MKRDDLTPLGLSPKGPVPTLESLCDEFGAWCVRRGLERIPDDTVLMMLLDRRQRWWLTNFIARWDWATEDDAQAPGARCTPLELAGAFVTVAREHSSRGEFAKVLAAGWQLSDYLDVDSVMSTAFARVHRIPVDGARTAADRQADERLKLLAMHIVHDHLIPARET